MNNLTINQKLIDDPFRVIYYKALETFEIHTLADRIEFLDRLADGIHQVENDIKNSSEQSQWLGIVSGFGAALTIGAFIAIPLIPVAVLATMGTSSALVGIGNTVQRKLKLSPVQEDLERHYLALRSTESINWASLWDYCHKTTSNGDESFLRLMFKASRGTIQGNRLIRNDSTKEPFIAGCKAMASLQGRKVDEVATFVKAIKESFLSQQEKPIDSGWVPMPQPTHQPQIIGSTTRLGAIDVPAVQSSDSPWQSQSVIEVVSQIGKVKEVVSRNNSYYIAGSKGSGKGMFAANLLRWKLEQYPNAIALALDPKGDTKESGYWNHERIKHFSFNGIALSKKALNQKVIEFLAEARNLISQADITRGMRLFIVFDEFLFLKTNLDAPLFAEISGLCSNAISTGDSQGIHAIAITQSFNATDSVGSDEILKNLTQVGLFREDEYARAKKQVSYGRVNTDKFSDAEFKALASQSPVKRVMSIAGEFIPTPELENFSAFNRDSGTVIKPLVTGQALSDGDRLVSVASQQIEQMKTQVQTVASAEVELFAAWNDYPVHQAILRYLHGKTDKSDRQIYDALRNSRKTVDFAAVQGGNDFEKVKAVLKYLKGKAYITTNSKGECCLSPNINTR